MKLIPTTDIYYLLDGLKEEKMTSPKKTPEKDASKKKKKIVEEVAEGYEKSSSSSKINDVSDMDFCCPSTRSHKTTGA